MKAPAAVAGALLAAGCCMPVPFTDRVMAGCVVPDAAPMTEAVAHPGDAPTVPAPVADSWGTVAEPVVTFPAPPIITPPIITGPAGPPVTASPPPIPTITLRSVARYGTGAIRVIVDADRVVRTGYYGRLTIQIDNRPADSFRLHWRGKPDRDAGDDEDTEAHIYAVPVTSKVTVTLTCGSDCNGSGSATLTP